MSKIKPNQEAKTAKEAKPDAEPIERVGKHRLPWLRFVLIVIVLLAFDLGLKYWSFQNVADMPVRVQTAEEGGPEVFIQSPIDDSWSSAYHDLAVTSHPSLIPRHEPIVLVPSALNFQLTLNTGAVFGIGQGARPFFILVSAIAFVVIVFLFYRSPLKARAYQIALAFILGGALGNLYDRVLYSAVRDMLHMLPGQPLPFGLSYPWGGSDIFPWIFNIADVVLLIGVGLVLVLNFLSEREASKKAKMAQVAK